MIIAQRRLNLNLNSLDIEKSRDTYWKAHAKNSYLYEDAQIFLNELKKRNIPLILMTSGDSVMQINQDLTLTYNPEFSGSYKMRRIDILPLHYTSIILGETVDKPDTKFFDLVYKDVLKLGSFDKKTILYVGDSPKSDLMVPENDGYSTLLIKR